MSNDTHVLLLLFAYRRKDGAMFANLGGKRSHWLKCKDLMPDYVWDVPNCLGLD